ncbi:c-type cytochrome [Shewanella sp. YIC-542]|uniref:c-type cytochrome n=1 Tax=Shewanella mytili TaxID=3377111 RepID=UPI00398E84DB
MKILPIFWPALWLASSLFQVTAATIPEKINLCSSCHGVDGNSTNPLYPSLAAQRPLYLQRQLQAFKDAAQDAKTAERYDPVMTALAATLSAAEIEALAQYYAAQPRQHMTAALIDEQGRKLYQGGDLSRDIAACAACHGRNGEGLATAGFPALAGQHPQYILLQLQKFKNGTRQDHFQGMMQNSSAKLTEQDMAMLAEYIAQLPNF